METPVGRVSVGLGEVGIVSLLEVSFDDFDKFFLRPVPHRNPA
jgi:hypothetical protein